MKRASYCIITLIMVCKRLYDKSNASGFMTVVVFSSIVRHVS